MAELIFIQRESQTTVSLDLYVNDVTGDDANPGTLALPLKTYGAAVAKIPDQIESPDGSTISDVTIHLAPHGSAAGYPLVTIENKATELRALIHITGDDNFTELVAPTAAGAGSGSLVVISAALTIDAYLGKTIEILTGAAAGDRRLIRNNSATDIVPVSAFSAAVAPGDSYRIVEPSVVLQLPSLTFGSQTLAMFVPAVRNCPGMAPAININSGPDTFGPAVVFSNLQLRAPTVGEFGSFTIQSSSVALYGVELTAIAAGFQQLLVDENSTCICGMDKPPSIALFPVARGLAPSSTSWRGWGFANLISAGGAQLHEIQRFCGYMCSNTLTRAEGQWRILGGRFHESSVAAGAISSFLAIGEGSLSRFDNTASPQILVTNTANAADRGCVEARGGAAIEMSNTLLQKTNQGFGLAAWGDPSGQGTTPGRIGLGAGVTITGITDATAPTYGIYVTGGGTVAYRGNASNPTMSGWPVGQQLAVRTTFILTGSNVQLADKTALAAAGAALPAIGTADGRYGWIRRLS